MNLRTEPIVQCRVVENHRHAIVNLAHESIGSRRQNRKRATFEGSAWSPCIPNACDTHNRITLQMDLEGALSLTFHLPFVKAAQGNDAPLSQIRVPEKGDYRKPSLSWR